jgi:heme A synthase
VLKLSTLAIAWTALSLTALLSLQGAVVRATGSGDGCGRYWPTCHGELIPSAPSLETGLEFGHRLLTILLAVVGLWLFSRAFRSRRERPGLWLATLGAAFFFVLQSLVGAATVIFGLTGDNASLARSLVLPIHLVNSVSMLGALVLAVLYARQRTPGRWQLGKRPLLGVLLGLGLFGMYLLMFSGGVAALGSTLFPAESLREGIAASFSYYSHLLVRLRAIHPLLGATVGIYLVLSLGLIRYLVPSPEVQRVTQALVAVYLLQLVIGVATLAFLTPLVLSLLHLAVAMLSFGLYAALVAYALGTTPAPAVTTLRLDRSLRAAK